MTNLEHTKALYEKAELRNLVAMTTGVKGGDHWYICDEDASVAMISANDGVDEELRQPRAELFVHAVNALPVLVAETEELRAKVAAYESDRSELLVKILQRVTDSHEEWKQRWGPNLRITVGKGHPLADSGIEQGHGIEVEVCYDVSIMHEDGTETKIEGERYTVTPIPPDEHEDGDW